MITARSSIPSTVTVAISGKSARFVRALTERDKPGNEPGPRPLAARGGRRCAWSHRHLGTEAADRHPATPKDPGPTRGSESMSAGSTTAPARPPARDRPPPAQVKGGDAPSVEKVCWSTPPPPGLRQRRVLTGHSTQCGAQNVRRPHGTPTTGPPGLRHQRSDRRLHYPLNPGSHIVMAIQDASWVPVRTDLDDNLDGLRT